MIFLCFPFPSAFGLEPETLPTWRRGPLRQPATRFLAVRSLSW